MNGRNLGAENVVAGGDLAGDGDSVGIAVVVEDGVSAPLACLLLSASLCEASALRVAGECDLVDFEELEFGLVDLGAVAVASSEPGGGPAVVGAVPADLVAVALSVVLPGELDVAASVDICVRPSAPLYFSTTITYSVSASTSLP